MKRIFLICIIHAILLCVSCGGGYQPFTKEMADLSNSMQLYFELERDEIFYGNFFQGKIVDGYQYVEYLEGKGDISRYTYEFIIAPTYNIPYMFEKIEIYPLDEPIYSYIVRSGIDAWMNEFIWDLSEVEYPKKKCNSDYHAYIVSAQFDDRGSLNRNALNVSIEQFDEGMRSVKMVIYYNNWEKDEIIFHFNEDWNTTEKGLLSVMPYEEYIRIKNELSGK